MNITKPGYTITVSSETLSGPIYYVNTSGASVVGKWIIDEASGSTAVELKSGYQWSYFAGENSPYNRSGTYQVFNDVATLMDSNGATVATARLLHKNVLYLDGINRYEYLSEYFRINDDTQTFIRQGTPSLTGKWTGSIGGTVVTVTINADTSWSLTSATGIYQLEGTGSRSGNTGSLAIPPPNGQGESTEDINLNLESENSMSVSVHRSSTLPLGTFTLTRTGS